MKNMFQVSNEYSSKTSYLVYYKKCNNSVTLLLLSVYRRSTDAVAFFYNISAKSNIKNKKCGKENWQ